MNRLQQQSWLWSHQAGSHNGAYNLPADSTITPAEAGRYLGIDRFIHVCLDNEPRPPFQPHAESLRDAEALVWSIVGDSSSTRNNLESDLEPVLDLKRSFPNLVGGIMDDFFQPAMPSSELARWSVQHVAGFHERLRAHRLDLWVVVYDLLMELPIQPWLEHCDVITYWTWQAKNLSSLDENFRRLASIAPHQRKLLGCYMWDYGSNAPMPPERMAWQCDQAQTWLDEGRIDGVIFLASNLCDLDLDSVRYIRNRLACEEP